MSLLPLFRLPYPRNIIRNIFFEKVSGTGPGRRAEYNVRRSAPLAQTAEHFHGKEGVYGSIP